MSDFFSEVNVDFMFDFYAILGVERDASETMINQAFRDKIRQYHPDHYHTLAPEFEQQASVKASLLNEAKSTLVNSDTRLAYDQRLESWTGPLSTDGSILAVRRSGFYLSSLVSGQGMDEKQSKKLQQQIAKLTGDNDQLLRLIGSQVDNQENLSPELADAYEDLLQKRALRLYLEEDRAWEEVGVFAHELYQTSSEHLALTQAELQSHQEQVAQAVNERFEALPQGQVLALTEGREEVLEGEDVEVALEQYRQNLLQNMRPAEDKILALAKERQAITQKRLRLIRLEYRPEQPTHFLSLYLCVQIGDNEQWMLLNYEDSEQLQIAASLTQKAMAQLHDLVEAQNAIDRGSNVAFLRLPDGLDVDEVINEAINLHFQPLLTKSSD